MAYKFLDYEGLARYDSLIKALIKSGDSELIEMINEIKDAIEGSDDESVASKIEALNDALTQKIDELESKHDDDKEELEGKIADVDERINTLIGGAPEILDTLKEIADWIASDESGTADLISQVVANREDIDAAKKAFENHDERLGLIEEIIGVDSESEGESVIDRLDGIDDRLDVVDDRLDGIDDRLDGIDADFPTAITDAEIASLFLGGIQSVAKYANTASSITSISATDAKNIDLVVTSDAAVNALTENKTYKSIAIGSSDIETKLTVKADEDITIDGANINGRGEDATGNGSINYTAKDLTIKDVNISGNTNYNVFEGTQDTTDKSAHIENLVCSNVTVDDPSIKHNVVNVYTPADGAKISIKDSSFILNADNSNVLRMSNYLNSDNVEITFENCDWKYVGGDMKWAGLMIYQPASKDVALNGDMSHLATWKIKFINCKYDGDLITENISGDHQALYTYNMNNSKECVGGADAITSVGWTVTFE